jgi:hypothetical protein
MASLLTADLQRTGQTMDTSSQSKLQQKELFHLAMK